MYLVRGGWRNETARRFHALFCHPVWNVGIVAAPIHVFLDSTTEPEVTWLPPLGPGRYLADPFGLASRGKIRVVCEEFDYARNRGVIITFELSDGFRPIAMETVMDEPIHLSYPYLFEDEGHVYCVPETFALPEISLYEADESMRRWRKVVVLVQGVRAHDTTLFRHRGRWWLLYTDVERGPFDKLFIWHSPELKGPWQPHRKNPVKTDPTSSRGAGTPFLHHGELYRPSQDCSRTYGRRVIINRITELSPENFEEEVAAIVEPRKTGPYRDGIHTISAVGNVTLVDGYRVAFEKAEFRRAWSRERNRVLRWLTPKWHRG